MLTITKAYRAEVGLDGQKETKPHVEFAEIDKMWTVNKTNLGALCDAFDRDSFDGWIGKKIQLSKGWGSHGFGKPDGQVVVLVILDQDGMVQEKAPEREGVSITADDVETIPVEDIVGGSEISESEVPSGGPDLPF